MELTGIDGKGNLRSRNLKVSTGARNMINKCRSRKKTQRHLKMQIKRKKYFLGTFNAPCDVICKR